MHIKKIAAIFTCLIITSALVGCSKNSTDNSSSSAYIQKALNTINKANQGYIAKNSSKDKSLTYQQYRQDALENAIAPLQKAISSGTSTQRANASALLAQIQASASRFYTRKANNEYALWLASTGDIISQAVSIDSAAQRVNILKIDNSKGTKALQSYIKKLQSKSESIKKQIKQEQSLEDSQKKKVKDLQKKASKLMSQSQEAHQKGFVLNDDKKYDFYDKAGKFKSQSADVSFKAQRHKIKLHTHTKKLTYLKIKLDSISDGIDKTKKRIKEFESQKKNLDNAKAKAKQNAQEAIKKLISQFKKLNKKYQNSVDKTYSKAGNQASKAVTTLEEAQQNSSAGQREELQLKLIFSYLNQTDILLSQASATKGFLDLIKLITVDKNNWLKAQNSAVKDIQEKLQALKSKQENLVKNANEVIEKSKKVASKLSASSERISKIVKAQQKIISSYSKMIKELSS